MPDNLDAQLKASMGYIDKARTCKTCEFRSEIDDPLLERNWLTMCTFVQQVATLRISDSGVCNKWKEAAKGLKP